ncbi:MAG: hypothetical protein JXR65_11080 [Bacteroidales bacterium]|nr:hypothetical protein [Bacteroidales bacterium]
MDNSSSKQPQENPIFLKVMCSLTFLGSGLSFLSYITIYVLHKHLEMFVHQYSNMNWMGTKLDLSFLLTINPLYFLLMGLFSALAFSGAFYMWHLRKIGFHLYTIAQIVMLIIPKLFVPDLPFPYYPMIISGLFIYFYGMSLRLMR